MPDPLFPGLQQLMAANPDCVIVGRSYADGTEDVYVYNMKTKDRHWIRRRADGPQPPLKEP